MIALPSIAFGGFSGSAKGVTARQVGGRSILSVRSWPTGVATAAQVVRRASISKITKSYKTLTADQMLQWEKLAQHASGASVFGQKAQLSAINLYVRLNANRVMAGESIISDAPLSMEAVPNVVYKAVVVTPELVAFSNINRQASPYKLVVKMSSPQSAGISNGWSKTVIITTEAEDDWGVTDVTTFYLKTLGVKPVSGQKIFVETYWMNTENGFVGEAFRDSVICVGEGEEASAGLAKRVKLTLENTDPEETHVSSFVLDYSTGGPVVQHDAVLLGHSNVASSVVKYPEKLDAALLVRSMCAGRGCGEDGNLKPQSYVVTMYNSWDGTEVTYGHRGGDYRKPTEVFGPGVIYQE